MTYTATMSDVVTDDVGGRTEAVVVREMAELAVRLTMLELELKRLRNPAGFTLADLEGVWPVGHLTDEQIERGKVRVPAKVDRWLAGQVE